MKLGYTIAAIGFALCSMLYVACNEGPPGSSDAGSGEACACIAPDPGVWDMVGVACTADHDCQRWSPCIDYRCDGADPSIPLSGHCSISVQVEPTYCGEAGPLRYVCNTAGACCPDPSAPPVIP